LIVSSAALAATLLSLSQQASAAVPEPLEAITTQRALRFGSVSFGGVSNIPHRVTNLATSGVRSLAWPKRLMAGGLLVLVALAGLLCGLLLRPRPEDASIKNQLQGSWAATSMNMGGIPIPGPQARLTFQDNQLTLLGASGTYRIDAGKDPMQMDWTVNGVVTHWILELHGDELTLCALQPPDGQAGESLPPPTDFRPQPGKNVIVFKRLLQ
jgi:uncharacterized protein (TIGR03067 family)